MYNSASYINALYMLFGYIENKAAKHFADICSDLTSTYPINWNIVTQMLPCKGMLRQHFRIPSYLRWPAVTQISTHPVILTLGSQMALEMVLQPALSLLQVSPGMYGNLHHSVFMILLNLISITHLVHSKISSSWPIDTFYDMKHIKVRNSEEKQFTTAYQNLSNVNLSDNSAQLLSGFGGEVVLSVLGAVRIPDSTAIRGSVVDVLTTAGRYNHYRTRSDEQINKNYPITRSYRLENTPPASSKSFAISTTLTYM